LLASLVSSLAPCPWRREYVSVSCNPILYADLERGEAEDPKFEKEELAQIYVGRGVEIGLARQVAQQLMVKDALGAHARDELGISEITSARPVQAALTSAATFSAGAAALLALFWLYSAASAPKLVGLRSSSQ
jgi:VIT1/CCC1 family predicted Fe2+/Mn2+ transporter